MATRAQKLRLGVFLTVTLALLVLFVLLIAGRQLLQRQDTYYIEYSNISVNGLQIGGAVKYQGIDIGTVTDIGIDPNDVQTVVVTIQIEEGTPIKQNAIANLVPVGITGLMQVEISGGTQAAPLLEPGSVIRSGSSAFQTLMAAAEDIAIDLTRTISNAAEMLGEENQRKLSRILDNVDMLVEENRPKITSILSNVETTSYHLARTSAEADRVVTKFGEDIDEADIAAIAADLKEAIARANSAVSSIDLTILRKRDDISYTIDLMRETMDSLNQFALQISENPWLLLRGSGRE